MTSTPSARSRAQSHFKSPQQRDDAVRDQIEKDRAVVDAKTARLKALRMAKQAEEKIEADRLVAQKKEDKARIAATKAASRTRKSQS
jgi:Arc/MetJ-type ribon-helix-helix transcriptional regulator